MIAGGMASGTDLGVGVQSGVLDGSAAWVCGGLIVCVRYVTPPRL
ncbi:hypothetical protein Com2_41 [Cutibacterium phage CaCom2]|nr:hypothetical protein Com2_41 [Cutibacterium phage CaCom2]